MPDRPMNTRGTPIERFNPLRDAKTAENPDLAENGESADPDAPIDLVRDVRLRIAGLKLTGTAEGSMAVTLAQKATEATGSAAAACLHELRMLMDDIRQAKPVAEPQNTTEDVLGRRRERKAEA